MPHPATDAYLAFHEYQSAILQDGQGMTESEYDALLKCWCSRQGLPYAATVQAFDEIEHALN